MGFNFLAGEMQLSSGALLPWHRSACSSSTISPKTTPMSLGALGSSKSPAFPSDLRFLSEIRRSGEKTRKVVTISASASCRSNSDENLQILRRIGSTAGALILTAAAAMAALHAAKLGASPARAEAFPAPPMAERATEEGDPEQAAPSALSQFLESNAEAVEALRALLYEKLDNGEYRDSISILDKLISAQPSETEWRFLSARVHDEIGDLAGARRQLEEILSADPLSFEALFQIAVLMDRCGQGDAAMARLESALELAREGGKEKEARNVRLIMAQLQYLQKNVDDAISSYEELAMEDPRDYRPFFCQGVIYSLLDRNEEAREMFAKYKRLSPRKFDVEGFLQTSLSRVKLF